MAHVLAKDPDRRFPSAAALIEDLEDILAARSARHSAGWRRGLAATIADVAAPERTMKFDLQPLLSATDAQRDPAIRGPAESFTIAAVPKAPDGGPPSSRELSVAKTAATYPTARQAVWWAVSETLGLIALLGLLLPPLVGRSGSREPSDAGGASRAAEPATARSPEPAGRTAAPAVTAALLTEPSARLLVDLEHPLKSGRLRLWISGKLALDQRLRGETEKKLKVIKVRAGELEDTLKLRPGRHEIEVAVNWEDNERRQHISGVFGEGQARHLEIRVGRLRKNLSLDWR
jgi:hypothetical protein